MLNTPGNCLFFCFPVYHTKWNLIRYPPFRNAEKYLRRHFPETEAEAKIKEAARMFEEHMKTAQQSGVLHVGFDRPTVLVTEGYAAHYATHPRYQEELSKLFNANPVSYTHLGFFLLSFHIHNIKSGYPQYGYQASSYNPRPNRGFLYHPEY